MYPTMSLRCSAAKRSFTLLYVSDTEAQVETKAGMVKVVREADEWKVDGTDGIKKALPSSLPLSTESKERLEKF